MRLTWVQPEDLLVHELVQSATEGRDVASVARAWTAAGGDLAAPVSGAADIPATPALRATARELLAALDELPVNPEVAAAEPSDLAEIEATWSPLPDLGHSTVDIADRVHGGWLGRAVGCLLGKPVEKIPREGIREILQSEGRWPLSAYFTAIGLPADVAARWPWNRRSAPTSLMENIDGMPEDDDLNFPLIALGLLEAHGSDFTTSDVAAAWLDSLPAGRVFTAERVAYRNLLDGYEPPDTATTRNPFREWIGAGIRTDVYGWAMAGRPREAARLAWRDARLSHTANGIYSAMFVAAMCAAACVADEVRDVLAAGLSVVPPKSRLAGAVRRGIELGVSGVPQETALDLLHEEYGDLHWVHSVNNAAAVAYALASTSGEFGPAICVAVTAGWDTDSDGATVGSICGALLGAARLPAEWIGPLDNRLSTSMPGLDQVRFDDLAARTVAVMKGVS